MLDTASTTTASSRQSTHRTPKPITHDNAYSCEYDYKGAQQQNKGQLGHVPRLPQSRPVRCSVVDVRRWCRWRPEGHRGRHGAARCSRTYSSSPSTSTARTSQPTRMRRALRPCRCILPDTKLPVTIKRQLLAGCLFFAGIPIKMLAFSLIIQYNNASRYASIRLFLIPR